ncbi:lyase family protein [Saccharicrinis aurantiacus]|uniref:lyase family protein n=1 Tax=Saccharicrinis aurantiacus TaxID=1849719 RepID=UPI0024919CB7|nr:lyase family protein [Saccharicrinis aurantiacus]
MRKEYDFIGTVDIPDDALYGIHSVRARDNFPDNTRFHKEWYQAVGTVKEACYVSYKNFKVATQSKFGDAHKHPFMNDATIDVLIKGAKDVALGKHYNNFIVPAMQGGAGTSINLNINEIITNVALGSLGYKIGDYSQIDPIESANIFQSTNDIIPSALKVASMQLLNDLDKCIDGSLRSLEKIESATRNRLRIAYTQMQAAVPSSYDKLFSAYNNALSRDWWRVSKCNERIKEVNLGGGAIGTGMSIPSYFIIEATRQLQRITGLPLTRSENLMDTTSNLDVYVEVHATLKSHAVNLEKMVADLRLLSSDLFIDQELTIAQKQVGSSIMPGKINPVISEFVISAAHKIYANDLLISNLCGQGCLELNAYIPTIGHALIDSLKLLIACNKTITQNLLKDIQFKKNDTIETVLKNPSITTALSPYIGYHKAAELAQYMKTKNTSILDANKALKAISDSKLNEILQPAFLLKLGYRIDDL